MLPLERNGIPASTVRDALHWRNGRRYIKFRYDLIRGGVPIGQLPVISGSVRYSAKDAIQRTAKFEMADDSRINWLSDLIKPYMMIQIDEKWVEFPLGVFVPTTPTKQSGSSTILKVEAYDKTIYAREDCVVSRAFWAAGTSYLSIVQSLLTSVGLNDILVTSSTTVLPTDREWDIGTSKLDIINTLLSEINYIPLNIDAEGIAVLSPYRQPSADSVTYTYRADELSVLSQDVSSTLDLYCVPNVFIAVVSNPEIDPLQSIYINDNPESELSTIRRGRNIVSELYKPDAIASQTDLDVYVRRKAFEASQVYETVSVQTGLMPIHEAGEVLEIRHPSVNGIYEEIGWEMDLRIGGQMSHEIRRVVQI